MFKNRRRFALLLGAISAGALLGWLGWSAAHPRWGGEAVETFIVRRARESEWKRVVPARAARWQRLTRDNAPGWYGIFAEPVQTLAAYRAQNPRRPTATRGALVLVPLGSFSPAEKRQLQELREFCALYFALPTRLEAPLPLEPLNVPARGENAKTQFDADAILARLAPRLPADAVAYLAVTNRDLWSGDLSFVFGLASLENRVGVYSLARYRAKGARDRELRRACQVLGHETGHMFGITHCVFYRCVMNGSNSLPDADGTPLDLCPACEAKLRWNIGYEGAQREAALNAFYARHFAPDWIQSLPARAKKPAS